MTEILGLFARAGSMVDLLDAQPEHANAQLDRIVEGLSAEIDQAAPPILYRLQGTEPSRSTPMQYGGFFLERERELLSRAKARGETWLLVEAGEDAYLDFVSDLPADVFAWDALLTGFPLAEMRKLRSGRLCTNEPGSDEDFAAIAPGKEVAGVAH